ncbi:transcription termination/antitermination NusG family protein, partial [Xanthomonas perforans]
MSSRSSRSGSWLVEENQAVKRWYVVHAYSGFEKSVAQALRDRIARAE